MIVYSNNQSGIHLCKNVVLHKRIKNIDVKLHSIRIIVSENLIKFGKVDFDYNLADIGT